MMHRSTQWSLTAELHLHDTNRLPMRNNQICNCYLMQAPFGETHTAAAVSPLSHTFLYTNTHARTYTHTGTFLNILFKLWDHQMLLGGSSSRPRPIFFYQRVRLLSGSVSHLLSPDIYHIIISQSLWLDIAWICYQGFGRAGVQGLLSTKDRNSVFLCSVHDQRASQQKEKHHWLDDRNISVLKLFEHKDLGCIYE